MAADSWLRSVAYPARRQLLVPAAILLASVVPLIAFPHSSEARCAFVVVLMAYLWMTESIPLAATSLIPVVAYPMLGILSAKDVSKEYVSDSSCIFIGSMIMAVAVEITNLHERIALRVLLFTGTSPRWLMLGFQLATAFVSMWITNTATATLMLPILLKIISELERVHRFHKSATATTALSAELGVACAAPCAVSPTLSGVKMLDSPCSGVKSLELDSPTASLESSLQSEMEWLELDPKQVDPRQLRVYKGLLLSVCYSASIGGTATLIGTAPNLVLSDYINRHFTGKTPLSFFAWFAFAMPGMLLLLLFCWLWLQFLYVGFEPGDKELEMAVHRVLVNKQRRLGSIRYHESTVLFLFTLQIILWLTRQPGFVSGWGDLFESGYVTDGTVVILISLLLFYLPAVNPFSSSQPTSLTATPNKKSSHLPTILTWEKLEKRLSWGTVLLLGGSIAMAKGVDKSGLSELIGLRLNGIQQLPEWLFVLIACVIATGLTEFSSNVATASIFVPILGSIAKNHGVNPLTYTLPVVISCSFAFMLPAGTPPNAIVFSAKVLKVTDMMRAGWILNAFALTITVVLSYTWMGEVFDLDQLPDDWVINGNITDAIA